MGKKTLGSAVVLAGLALAPGAKADALQQACEKAFYETPWAQKHEFLKCTDQGWAIARRLETGSEAECLLLSPARKLAILVAARQKTPLYFAELASEKYILSSNQEAVVSVRVDKTGLHKAFQPVLVSKAPPLRYAFGIELDEDTRSELARGHQLTATIAGRDWNMSLRGSSKALEQAESCLTQSTGGVQ